jgi:hypothetical protein
MEHWMNDPDMEKPKYSGTCSRAPLSTTDLTENDLALNLGLCSLTGMEPVASKFTDCAN